MAAASSSQVLRVLLLTTTFVIFTRNPNFLPISCASDDEFSILHSDFDSSLLFHGDYTPSPPPPSLPPHPPSLTCEGHLDGIGSLDMSCKLNSSLSFTEDVYIEGLGSLYILPGVTVSCPVKGCSILVNISGEFNLGENSVIIAGTVFVSSWNASLLDGSVINTTGLAGVAPAQTRV